MTISAISATCHPTSTETLKRCVSSLPSLDSDTHFHYHTRLSYVRLIALAALKLYYKKDTTMSLHPTKTVAQHVQAEIKYKIP